MIDSILLRNLQTSQSIRIDQQNSDFVLEKVDFGVVNATHHSYSYVNQIGTYIQSTSLGERNPSISGWIIGKTYEALQDNKSKLNRLVNPLYFLEAIVYEKYKLRFKPDFSVQYSSVYSENNEVLCKFLIQGTCEDPTFTTVSEQGALIAATLPRFRFPWVIPKNQGALMGLRNPELLSYVQNQGDIDTGMTISFSCTSTVQNPSLFNVITREEIKINKPLSPEEKIIVSTLSGNKFIKGYVKGKEYNYMKYRDVNSVWLQLHTGENILKYDADDNLNSLEVEISFYPRYLEVQ